MATKQKNINQKGQRKQQTVAEVAKEVPSSFSPTAIQVLTIILFAFILYGNTISYKYALDDAIVITENKFTKKGFDGIKDILTKDTFFGFFGENKQLVSGGRYRPLSLVTFAIEYQFFGESPAVSHFVNILLYALTGIVLLLLLKELLREKEKDHLLNIPFLVTLLFLAHPLHTEVVANIKGRDEIMCFLGCMTALYWIVKFSSTNKYIYAIGAVLIYFLALMSKENAITFLAIIPLTLFFFTNSSIAKTLRLIVPFLGIAVCFWLLRGSFTKSTVNMEVTEVLNNPFVYMTAMQKYATVVFTFGKYLLLLLFPHPLTHDYYYNQIPAKSWSDLRVIATILIYAGLTLYAFLNIRKKNIFAYSILFYLITFSIVSNVFFPIGTTMSERFVYISSFGFCLAIGYFLTIFTRKNIDLDPQKDLKTNTVLTAVFGIIILLYSVKTITRNEVWENNLTLFTTDVKTSPNSAKLQNSAGGEVMAASDLEKDPQKRKALLDESISHLNKALEIYPDYTIAWLLLGNAYYKYDAQYSKAIDCYKHIIKISPNYADAYFNLAVTYQQMGKLDDAIKNYVKLLSYKPNDVATYYTVGDLLKRKNSPDSALGFFNKVIQLDPNYPDVYRAIGTTYGQLKGDIDNAIVWLKKAIEVNPKDESAMENLGIAYGFKKDYDSAIAILNKAIELNPNNANAYRNLGISYLQKGDKAKAQGYLQRANELAGKR